MKIEDLLSLPVHPVSSPGAEVAGKGKDKFAQCLKEAVALQQQEAGPQALGGPAPLDGVAQAGATGAAQEMVDTVLSRLEIFQEALSRPGLSLKGLSPLAQALAKDSQHLNSLAKSLPADSSLRPIVEETAALTYTESAKFSRGDYL
jgi:hypothetical protein|uniref:Uncharacterized protein n=1 Tax=Desulfobacca acetoxidans TaxID=60893 RepID=A0A7V6A309_9BACT